MIKFTETCGEMFSLPVLKLDREASKSLPSKRRTLIKNISAMNKK